jgi:hypothetical protein
VKSPHLVISKDCGKMEDRIVSSSGLPPFPSGRHFHRWGRLDCCFVGRRQGFALDLLFFHRGLNCLVAIELKVGRFEPEYLGKLNFYLEALDRNVRKAHEQSAIGVLLCASKNDEVVEFALSRSLSRGRFVLRESILPAQLGDWWPCNKSDVPRRHPAGWHGALAISASLTRAPTVTPEPSTFILLGTGFLGFAGAAGRRFLTA